MIKPLLISGKASNTAAGAVASAKRSATVFGEGTWIDPPTAQFFKSEHKWWAMGRFLPNRPYRYNHSRSTWETY